LRSCPRTSIRGTWPAMTSSDPRQAFVWTWLPGIPMLVIAVILVATGVVSAGFLGIAIGCTLMMALMMRGMGRGGGGTST
jgi:hypothetical protein